MCICRNLPAKRFKYEAAHNDSQQENTLTSTHLLLMRRLCHYTRNISAEKKQWSRLPELKGTSHRSIFSLPLPYGNSFPGSDESAWLCRRRVKLPQYQNMPAGYNWIVNYTPCACATTRCLQVPRWIKHRHIGIMMNFGPSLMVFSWGLRARSSDKAPAKCEDATLL